MLYSVMIRLVGYLYYGRNGQSRSAYRRTCESAGKSGKQIERCLILTFRVAESICFTREFRQWEHLLLTGGHGFTLAIDVRGSSRHA
jgi:hypothetical protein